MNNEQFYDAIVVGSGATGGVAARILCEAGLKVLLLEAGRDIQPETDLDERDEWDRGEKGDTSRQPIQSAHWFYDQKTKDLWIDDLNNPYEAPEDKPFKWFRSRIIGGRSLIWSKTCFRMSQSDFSAEGLGPDVAAWPISYAELAPHYQRVEEWMGVGRSKDNIAMIPDGGIGTAAEISPMGKLLKLELEEKWPGKKLVASRRANQESAHSNENGRYGKFTPAMSPNFGLSHALRTGNLTIAANSVAKRIVTKTHSTIGGVEVVSSDTKATRIERARTVVLCASTIESVRILLNSACEGHPEGLSNSSGLLGHYLMDHVTGICTGGLPKRKLRAGLHTTKKEYFYIPKHSASGSSFLGGFGARLDLQLKDLDHENYKYSLAFFGDVLPKSANRISVSKDKLDAYGIPLARIEMKYGENEWKILEAARSFALRLAEAWGGFVEYSSMDKANPGESIHEVGGARMGFSPKDSVLNKFNQSWDFRNLFVFDGSCFVTSGTQNPTLTMMALAARGSEHLVKELRAGNLN